MSSSTPWPADTRPPRPATAGAGRAWQNRGAGMAMAAALVMAAVLALCQPAAASTEALPEAHSARERSAHEAGPRNAAHPHLPGSRLRGQGKLRMLGLGIYQAHLWTLPGFRAEHALDHPVVLELTYLREFQGKTIAQRSLDEMRRAGPLTEAQTQRWLAAMQRLFPDVRSGDRVTGLYLPGQGTSFWADGRPLGEIADPEFGRRFFGIWLAPSTSQPGLRLSLLGLAGSSGL